MALGGNRNMHLSAGGSISGWSSSTSLPMNYEQ
jgi:hypothetical protein